MSSIIQGPKFGTVHLKEWIDLPENKHSVKMLQGNITVYQNKDLCGFDASNKEANWCLKIAGEKEEMYIFGCQIRGVTLHENTKTEVSILVHRVP